MWARRLLHAVELAVSSLLVAYLDDAHFDPERVLAESARDARSSLRLKVPNVE